MQETAAQRREQFLPLVILGSRGLYTDRLRLFDYRIDDVDLSPGLHALANKRGGFGDLRRGSNPGDDRSPVGQFFIQNRDIKITINRHRQSARNGRGTHYQKVW